MGYGVFHTTSIEYIPSRRILKSFICISLFVSHVRSLSLVCSSIPKAISALSISSSYQSLVHVSYSYVFFLPHPKEQSLSRFLVVFLRFRMPCTCFILWLFIPDACLPSFIPAFLPFGVDESYGCWSVSARVW